MTGLFKNELIKTFKTGFVKAALCVILAFSILYPAGCYLLNSSVGEYVPTYFSDLAENEDSVEGKAYYNALDETEKFFYENKNFQSFCRTFRCNRNAFQPRTAGYGNAGTARQ
mgnify:CR=1 FL=1